MYTWICPTCGRECRPTWTECPDCVNKAANPAAVEHPAAQPAAAPAPQPAAAVYLPRPARAGLPTWALSILFAVAFGGAVSLVYYLVQRSHQEPRVAASAPTVMEKPSDGAAKPPHQLLRHLEIVGIRLSEDSKKKTQARFLVVNHSGAEIAQLAGKAILMGRSAKGGEAPVGGFQIQVPSLAPYEARELTVVVETSLRAYELPDWQYLSVQLEITSPQM